MIEVEAPIGVLSSGPEVSHQGPFALDLSRWYALMLHIIFWGSQHSLKVLRPISLCLAKIPNRVVDPPIQITAEQLIREGCSNELVLILIVVPQDLFPLDVYLDMWPNSSCGTVPLMKFLDLPRGSVLLSGNIATNQIIFDCCHLWTHHFRR